MEPFIAFLRSQELDIKSVTAYTKAVRAFQEWFENKHGKSATPDVLEDNHFIQYRDYLLNILERHARTVNKELAGIRKWLEWHQRAGRWPKPIEIRDVKIHTIGTAPKWLKLSDIGAILNGIEKTKNPYLQARDRAMLYLELYLGLRDDEVRTLHLNDVILTRGKEKIIIRQGKGGKYAELPLVSRKLRRALQEWIELRAESQFADSVHLFVSFRSPTLSRNATDRMLHRVRKLSNIPDFTSHSLRHSFNYHFNSMSKDLRMTKDVARHSSIQTTTIYTQPSEEDVRASLSRLDDLF